MNVLITWKYLADTDIRILKKQIGANVIKSSSKEEAIKLAPRADVIFGHPSADILLAASKCRWLQTPYAGVEKILAAKWANPQMEITNGSGIFGPPIAEHAIGLILAFNRGLHIARDNQNKQRWNTNATYSFQELSSATVGILGYGDLGSHVAKRLENFGCRIVVFRNHPTGSEEHEVYQLSSFPDFAGELDYLVCTLPETPETIGFLNKNRMQLLPKHAIIVNVGRGSLIPAHDLIYVLEQKIIAGAGLDVTHPEPLPSESPLWAMPNVIITPHNSAFTPFHKERILRIFLDNWHYFQTEGKPKINIVDPYLGY